ncbi:MAG: hypothetical protein QM723_16945 [Myxococcaceae bacterium]
MIQDEAGGHSFRSFEPFWEGPAHNSLLDVSADARRNIERLMDLLDACADPLPELQAMLSEVNWRPQLVAAVAMLCCRPEQRPVDALWRAMDDGSWVSPQLAVVASAVDPGFLEQARRRIEARCPISERLSGIPWEMRHSAAGPGSVVGHSAKLLSSLVAVVGHSAAPPAWFAQQRDDAEVKAMIASDLDRGGFLALDWLARLHALRNER